MKNAKTHAAEATGWRKKTFNSENHQDKWIRFHFNDYKINILCHRKGFAVEYRDWTSQERQELKEMGVKIA